MWVPIIIATAITALIAAAVWITQKEFKQMEKHPEDYPDQITSPKGTDTDSYMKIPPT